eukprot:52238-Amphidinium_carterae.1
MLLNVSPGIRSGVLIGLLVHGELRDRCQRHLFQIKTFGKIFILLFTPIPSLVGTGISNHLCLNDF